MNLSTISKYLEENQIPFNRYNSWNHCYEAFGTKNDSKILSLNLGFYLASWGMYRGSGKLLQKDYLIHEGAVEILGGFKNLKCTRAREIQMSDIDTLLNLISQLRTYYSGFDIRPTDTLISKIILGTLGCLPAFDRFFCDGVKSDSLEFRSLSKRSIENLFSFKEEKYAYLRQIQNRHPDNYYPYMKLIDMYFWQMRYEKHKYKRKL